MNSRASDARKWNNIILGWLRQREDEIAALIAELVAVPTENPPGRNYSACADLLEQRMREVGLECKRLENTEASREGCGSSVCLLAGYGGGLRAHGRRDAERLSSGTAFDFLAFGSDTEAGLKT